MLASHSAAALCLAAVAPESRLGAAARPPESRVASNPWAGVAAAVKDDAAAESWAGWTRRGIHDRRGLRERETRVKPHTNALGVGKGTTPMFGMRHEFGGVLSPAPMRNLYHCQTARRLNARITRKCRTLCIAAYTGYGARDHMWTVSTAHVQALYG